MFRWRWRFCCALLVTAGACTGQITGPEADDYVDDPGADEDEIDLDMRARPDLGPGMWAEHGLASAEVPPRGMGVFAEVVLEDGTFASLILETDDRGRVWQLLGPENLAGQPDIVAAAQVGPCRDGAHSLLPLAWAGPLEWRFRAGSTPTGMSKDKVEAVLRRATANITRQRDSCGLADRVSATHRYLGRTSQPANITNSGGCRATDGINSVDFGALPAGVLGVACSWWISDSGSAVESDVRLRKATRWYVNKPSGCVNRFSIESVMTHERGHSFGLGHVSESGHGALTMSTAIAPCNGSASTLGLGDVRGLRKKY